ncbi:MAG: hypothetical protein ABIF10_00755, partial [Candidatus Woesearchaeota archaeon]
AYLGRVYKYQKQESDFPNENEFSQKTYQEMLQELIQWELRQHRLEGVQIDFGLRQVRIRGKRAVLAMNEGYLCDYTLRQMLSVRHSEYEQEGYSLAKALVEAGIQCPKDVFVALYEKLEK